MPTGGVSLENAGEWIRAGAVALGVGSVLTEGALQDDYPAVARMASRFVAEIGSARQ